MEERDSRHDLERERSMPLSGGEHERSTREEDAPPPPPPPPQELQQPPPPPQLAHQPSPLQQQPRRTCLWYARRYLQGRSSESVKV
jgi:hypothetical protein